MQNRWLAALTLLIAITLPVITPANAAVFRVGLLHGDPEVFDYELSVLRLALANAPGDHSLEIVPLPDVPQNRVFAMLTETHPRINVFFSGYSLEREQHLLQVDIPLTRGLLGYRLFVVKKSRLEEFSEIDTLQQLQAYRIGSGLGWPENKIMLQNGLDLVTSQYDNLWRMLDYERFDLFHRGIQEVFSELRKPGRENLALLPHLAAAFRYDYFLYVTHNRPDLHQLLLQGLLNAYQSGAFMKNFNEHPAIRAALDTSDLADRHILRLKIAENNQSLSRIPSKYWHHPGDGALKHARANGEARSQQTGTRQGSQ